uniref:C3H1-type domain-containing protein n=1 Tax=Ganoderma boninense TaxID=34458 RepID=A0A5K1K427_9APHY|nr:C3H1-type domain-containing protein [Ganoderma boninense]
MPVSIAFCVVASIVEILLTNRGFSAFVPDTWIIAFASAMAVWFLTSVSMLVLFIFVVLRPADLIYTAISLVSTKLYANALLAAYASQISFFGWTPFIV